MNLRTKKSDPSAKVERLVKCPTCAAPTIFGASNLFRPFCSDRCKTGDLAAWASETYTVPVSDLTSDGEESAPEDDREGE
jgi:uncharacterized protein